MPLKAKVSGLGDPCAQFNVYIANRPNFSEYSSMEHINPLSAGEIHAVGQACGNGWRKVFNIYAKLVFALNEDNVVSLQGFDSWQRYRDFALLQNFSNTSLVFTEPVLVDTKDENNNNIHIIMGKTYAKSLDLPQQLKWLDDEFSIIGTHNLLVCPYFDYRQLSNIKIVRLVELVKQLKKQS